jgi:beta-lactamase regulating signal transducer with metallopeptidase domain
MNAPIWFSNLLFWSAQVAALVFAAWLLVQLLRIREPRVLLVYWRVLFAASLLLPLIEPWHRLEVAQGASTALSDVAPPISAPAAIPAASRWRLPDLFLAAEIVGVVILAIVAVRLAIFAVGLFRLRQLRLTSVPIPGEGECAAVLETASSLVGAKADFRISAEIDSPVTFGFARPIALLPKRFLSLGERMQSGIACHELLHVRRRDWAHHLAEEIVRAVFWFHPAVIWLVSRVRLAREQVVDLEVVRLTQARKPYLEALLEFTGAGRIAAIPAPPFLAERQLAERVALMLKEVRMSRTRLIASLGAIGCTLCLAGVAVVWAFPLKVFTPVPQSVAESGAAQSVTQRLVTVIRVTAKAKDGSALAGLTTDDFLLLEDGTQQKVESVIPYEFSTGPGYFVSFLAPRESDSTFHRVDLLLAPKWGVAGRDYTLVSGQAHYSKLSGSVAEGVSLGVSGGIADGVSGGISEGISQRISNGLAAGEGISRGASGGVSSGISTGVSEGISGGVSSGVAGEKHIVQNSDASGAVVDRNTIWPFTAKRGSMPLQVRGQGIMVADADGHNLTARIEVRSATASDIELGQAVDILWPGGHHDNGRVSRINRGASSETTAVDIQPIRQIRLTLGGGNAVTSVNVLITTGQLDDVLYIGRPVHAAPNSAGSIFKISKGGTSAERVPVQYGRASVNTIEVVSGLKEGDTVILSDMSAYDNFNRIQIKR